MDKFIVHQILIHFHNRILFIPLKAHRPGLQTASAQSLPHSDPFCQSNPPPACNNINQLLARELSQT